MNIEVQFWQLATLLLTLIGLALGGAKFLFDQIDRRLNERFVALEKSREVADTSLREELRRHSAEEARAVDQLQKLEKDFLTWRADLPMQYVRREDYVRNQTVIEAKIDKVFGKLELLQIQGGGKHD